MAVVLDRETISPKQARAYLEANVHNRNLREGRVQALAGAIHRGEWRETGDPIKFNGDGSLIDGQHRLAAIAKAGRRVTVWVARGVEEQVQEVVDTGSKRTLGDMLKLRGYENWNNLASATRSLWLYKKHGFPVTDGGWAPPTAQELLRLVELEKQLPEFVVKMNALSRRDPALRLPHGATTAMWMVFSKKASPEDADAFFDQLLAPTDGALVVLRKRLLQANAPHSRMPAKLKVALLVKAWNAWLRGERPRQLSWRAGGKQKEDFPKVEAPLQ